MDVFTLFDENPLDFVEEEITDYEDRWWDDRTWSDDDFPNDFLDEPEEEEMPDEDNVDPIREEVQDEFAHLQRRSED